MKQTSAHHKNDFALSALAERNDERMRDFGDSALVQLIGSKSDSQETRWRALSYLQYWSDTFQRVIAVRVVSESDPRLLRHAEDHMAEEIGHNRILARSRTDHPAAWDPVVAAASAWFVDQMAILSSAQRVVLAHLVLEGSGLVFHSVGAGTITENEYFDLHDEADVEHLDMGYRILAEMDDWSLESTLDALNKGWDMIGLLCDRVAHLALSRPDATL